MLADIQAGKWQKEIAELRRIRATDPDRYNGNKELLPTFFVSGNARSRKVMLNHSGLVQIDADHCGARLAEIRLAVLHDVHVAAAFASPSGDGLKYLVHVGPIASEAEHAAAYAAASSHIERITGHRPDPSCKNQNRHCFVSHDPELFTNGAAVPLNSCDTHSVSFSSLSPKECVSPLKSVCHATEECVSLTKECVSPRQYVLKPQPRNRSRRSRSATQREGRPTGICSRWPSLCGITSIVSAYPWQTPTRV